MDGAELNRFVTSHSFDSHPLISAKDKKKAAYYAVLQHFVTLYFRGSGCAEARLMQYWARLVGNNQAPRTISYLPDKKRRKAIKKVLGDWFKPWKRIYGLTLLCDVALVAADLGGIDGVYANIAGYLSKKGKRGLYGLRATLLGIEPIHGKLRSVANLISQYRKNRDFLSQKELRVLVTANMSAGKSTLINALVGKPVVKSAQEATTACLCYIHNKPFEDGSNHFYSNTLDLNCGYDAMKIAADAPSSIAAHFRVLGNTPQRRVCLIDSPGADSSMNKGHGILAEKALVEEKYDKLIHILNAEKLGTTGEKKHLQFVCKNVSHKKVIFVINKLDNFKRTEDSIPTSINNVRMDLQAIGFANPTICPISAYFSYLLKMNANGEKLDEDDRDTYAQYLKKFNKPEYDLSMHYNRYHMDEFMSDDISTKMGRISGLSGLEEILYRGAEK
jgi:GTP-binding protein EngB required for normal cell division